MAEKITRWYSMALTLLGAFYPYRETLIPPCICTWSPWQPYCYAYSRRAFIKPFEQSAGVQAGGFRGILSINGQVLEGYWD